jgi:hypothetical protein
MAELILNDIERAALDRFLGVALPSHGPIEKTVNLGPDGWELIRTIVVSHAAARLAERPSKETYLRPGQAAEMLGVSMEALKNWTKANHFWCEVTPGGHRRYPKEALLEAFRKERVKQDTENARLVG